MKRKAIWTAYGVGVITFYIVCSCCVLIRMKQAQLRIRLEKQALCVQRGGTDAYVDSDGYCVKKVIPK